MEAVESKLSGWGHDYTGLINFFGVPRTLPEVTDLFSLNTDPDGESLL